jgi:hypothetical protein
MPEGPGGAAAENLMPERDHKWLCRQFQQKNYKKFDEALHGWKYVILEVRGSI